MKSLKKIFLLLLCITVSVACASCENNSVNEDIVTATPTVAPKETPIPIPTQKPFDNLFEVLPNEFTFLSGVGAWQTVLTIEDDGSFVGKYTDSDMGVYDDDYYPNGTVYICNFK